MEGENIRSAKARIEGMMDKVVEGFEKQRQALPGRRHGYRHRRAGAGAHAGEGRPLRRRHDPGRLGEYVQEAPASGRGLLYAVFGMIGGIRTGDAPYHRGIRIPCVGPGTRRWSGPAYSRSHCWPIRPPCPQRAHSPVRRPRTEWGAAQATKILAPSSLTGTALSPAWY